MRHGQWEREREQQHCLLWPLLKKEGGSKGGGYVIHAEVCQKTTKFCKAIILQFKREREREGRVLVHRPPCCALGCPAARDLPPAGEAITSSTPVSYSTAEGIVKAIALLLNANSESQSLKEGFDMKKCKRQLNRQTNGGYSKIE